MEKQNSHILLLGMQKGSSTLEKTVWQLFKKLNRKLSNPTSRLFIIAKTVHYLKYRQTNKK